MVYCTQFCHYSFPAHEFYRPWQIDIVYVSLDLCQHMQYKSILLSLTFITVAFLSCVAASHLPIVALDLLLQGRVIVPEKALH